MPRIFLQAGAVVAAWSGLLLVQPAALGQGTSNAGVVAEIRQADQQYAKARNARDFKALADQWTVDAELVEGGKAIRGREAIVAFFRLFAQAHPTARLQSEMETIKPLSPTLARVTGSMRMTESDNPRARWFTVRFDSLRVKEDGVWRIASSTVEQIPDAKLDDLSWLVGTWKAADKATGQAVEATFEKAQNGKLLLGRLSTTGNDGQVVEVLQVLQADPREGTIRCWLFESSGGRAEGFMEHDGATYNTTLTGVPPAAQMGDKAESVQVLTPTGPDGFTWHIIDRVIDGVKVPDQKPLLFRRAR